MFETQRFPGVQKWVRNATLGLAVSASLYWVTGCVLSPQPPGDACANVTCADGQTCESGVCVPSEEPQAFKDASIARGGALYDEFWEVVGVDAPVDDHPLWASRPDMESNTRTGSDTWRCKECHGWDYKGKDGAYATGGHATGIAGIFNTTMGAQAVFDLVKTDHGYGDAGLDDAGVWDVAKFVLQGQIDTDEIIDANGKFNTGDVVNGQTLFENGIGTNLACSGCHGNDGLATPPGGHDEHGEFTEFPGLLSNENPWEFQHKVRFGVPGTAMPQAEIVGATLQDVADVAAYAQTLPQALPEAP